MKSPLRYPGGKTRAVKHILPYIPENCKELCAPFLGGASVELAVAARGTRVYGYDVFTPIVWFWQSLLSDPHRLAALADSYRVEHTYTHKGEPVVARGLPVKDFLRFRREIAEDLENNKDFSHERAAKVYAINRSSFSGATFSGGFSKRASYARFTDSSITRVRAFKQPNLLVGQADFKESISQHSDAFLYLDPPYMLAEGRNKLYGVKGSTHDGFDHEGLCSLLKDRRNWVMSYNDHPHLREMYKEHTILNAQWAYGMNKSKKSSEILIICRGNND